MAKNNSEMKSIRKKLVAAVAMVLVASVMVVSSSYAWFTLSTAPEIKGIQTSVGANGNLEMALMPADADTRAKEDFGITSTTRDSMDVQSKALANVTWGNLVDLAKDENTDYGLDQINLYPSELNLNSAGTHIMTDAFLKTPEYGADGRVKELKTNTTTAVYEEGSFAPNANKWGVRAIGIASGLTDRQMSFRNARAQVNSNILSAKNKVISSLGNRGSDLASIAMKLANDRSGATFDQKEVTAMKNAVTDLLDVLKIIDSGYKNALLAYSASSLNNVSDDVWRTIQSVIAANDSIVDVLAGLNAAATEAGVTLPADLPIATLEGQVNLYAETLANVEKASGYLDSFTGDDIPWIGVDGAKGMSDVLALLANPDEMTINNIEIVDVKDNLGVIAGAVTSGEGIFVRIKPDGGAYADIADHIGNYSSKVTVSGISYGTMDLGSMTATMLTQSAVNDGAGYQNHHYATLSGSGMEPSGTGGEVMPLSDFYGYIIDLAFRTNAPESNLELQVEPADRIYDQNNNVDTMGKGSSMTFNAVSSDFSEVAIKNLMKSIRIVFFNPENMEIVADARLDVDNATTGADGITAEMEVATRTGTPYFGLTYTATFEGGATGTQTVYYFGTSVTEETADGVVTTTTTYMSEAGTTLLVETTVEEEGKDPVITQKGPEGGAVTDVAGLKKQSETNPWGVKIMPLTQNTATPLSVLVYLDGTTVTNKDVAYNAETSLTGKMNLQFASSANLVPMEYRALHTVGDGSATYAVTTELADGVTFTGEEKATQGQAYVFELTGLTDQTVSYKVGADGTDTPLIAGEDGKYTIPGTAVTDAITITVAEADPAG